MEEQNMKTKRKNDKDIAIKKPRIDKERLRVSILNPTNLLIGKWKLEPMNEDELVVKCYFVRKQLTWEVLRNESREKVEIEWSNIIGIRTSLMENEPGVFEVELSEPPKFYKERDNVDVRAHDKWVDGLDFTGGQASICRRHFVSFPSGMLNKHFERLIRCDERLCELTKKPYPTNSNPYFDSNTFISAAALPSLGVNPTVHQIQPYNQTFQLDPHPALNLIPQRPVVSLPTFGSATTNYNLQPSSSSVGGHIGCSNGNLMNMGAPQAISNNTLLSNWLINDCLILNNGPTYSNGVSSDYLRNGASDSQGLLSNSYYSNWPTDSHGVWRYPTRQETHEETKGPTFKLN